MRVTAAIFAVVGLTLAAVSTPVFAQVGGFTDIPRDHWAADSVAKLATAGILTGDKQITPAKGTPAPKKGAYDGNKPVTRYELAVTLYRFVQYIDAANKQPKGKTKVQTAPLDGATAVKRLIADGYLPKNTPLAVSGTTAVTANQLADALAQVISRNREKKTPITPDSLKTLPVEKPAETPGT